MGRIYFKCKKAQEFLRNNDYVYTVRLANKKEGKVTVYFGKYRVAKGILRKVTDNVCRAELEKYVHASGFDTVEEWLEMVDNFFLLKGLTTESYKGLALYKLEVVDWLVTPKQLVWWCK